MNAERTIVQSNRVLNLHYQTNGPKMSSNYQKPLTTITETAKMLIVSRLSAWSNIYNVDVMHALSSVFVSNMALQTTC